MKRILRSGRLDHNEFKACLRALGFDLPVPQEDQPDTVFEAILDCVDFDRDGFVRLEEYMQVRSGHKLLINDVGGTARRQSVYE